jgi:hypothetical protein
MNDITALRSHLFDTLRDLRDPDKPMDIERAKAINETAQVIINSAKVEVDHMKIAGGNGSGFIGSTEAPALTGRPQTSQTATGTKTVTQLAPGATMTQHKLKG